MDLVQKEFSYSEYYEEQREYTGEVKRANKLKRAAWENAQGAKELKRLGNDNEKTIKGWIDESKSNSFKKSSKNIPATSRLDARKLINRYYLKDRGLDYLKEKDLLRPISSDRSLTNYSSSVDKSSPLKGLKEVERRSSVKMMNDFEKSMNPNKISKPSTLKELLDSTGKDLKSARDTTKDFVKSKAMKATKEVSKGFKDARDSAKGLIETKAKDTAKNLGSKLKGIAKFIKR